MVIVLPWNCLPVKTSGKTEVDGMQGLVLVMGKKEGEGVKDMGEGTGLGEEVIGIIIGLVEEEVTIVIQERTTEEEEIMTIVVVSAHQSIVTHMEEEAGEEEYVEATIEVVEGEGEVIGVVGVVVGADISRNGGVGEEGMVQVVVMKEDTAVASTEIEILVMVTIQTVTVVVVVDTTNLLEGVGVEDEVAIMSETRLKDAHAEKMITFLTTVATQGARIMNTERDVAILLVAVTINCRNTVDRNVILPPHPST